MPATSITVETPVNLPAPNPATAKLPQATEPVSLPAPNPATVKLPQATDPISIPARSTSENTPKMPATAVASSTAKMPAVKLPAGKLPATAAIPRGTPAAPSQVSNNESIQAFIANAIQQQQAAMTLQYDRQQVAMTKQMKMIEELQHQLCKQSEEVIYQKIYISPCFQQWKELKLILNTQALS